MGNMWMHFTIFNVSLLVVFVEMDTDVICSHFAPVDCEAGRFLYRSPRPVRL